LDHNITCCMVASSWIWTTCFMWAAFCGTLKWIRTLHFYSSIGLHQFILEPETWQVELWQISAPHKKVVDGPRPKSPRESNYGLSSEKNRVGSNPRFLLPQIKPISVMPPPMLNSGAPPPRPLPPAGSFTRSPPTRCHRPPIPILGTSRWCRKIGFPEPRAKRALQFTKRQEQ
jgi:hypothetical protein